MFKKTITSDFFTTISFSQALDSLYLLTFWFTKIFSNKENISIKNDLLYYIWKSDSKVISFYNWRSAIFHSLKMIWIKKGDEVIVNWYNCVSVSNAVIQSWAKIIYSDIEEKTLSFDLVSLEKNINSKTRAIILQHTFWKKPFFYDKIISLAKSKNIIIIEDLAHSLKSNINWKWDFLIFSTWRDKVISSVTWWFLVINNPIYFEKIQDIEKSLYKPNFKIIIQNILYNIVAYKAYKFYDFFSLWKVIIFLSRKLKLITEILSVSEKSCNFHIFNISFPNSLAFLARKELKKIEKIETKRKQIAKQYIEEIKNKKIEFIFTDLDNYNWFRFPILLKTQDDFERLVKIGKENKIIFWTSWSSINIAPVWSDLQKAHYEIWTCKKAEDISKRIITLPNHILTSQKDIKRVINILNNF